MDEKNLLHIYKYGDDVLKLKAEEIKNIDQEIVDLRQKMMDTMYHSSNAIGLAAPQVGKSLQMSVIDISRGESEDGLILLLNPEILEAEGSDVDEEGCLSFPGLSAPVKRFTHIYLKTIDIDGNEIKREVEGYMARVIQHEMDHLTGKLIIDHVSPLKRQVMKKDIKRLKRNGEW